MKAREALLAASSTDTVASASGKLWPALRAPAACRRPDR